MNPPSMSQELWSANFYYLASLWKRQRRRVFPWCRFQRDLYLFCKNDVYMNQKRREEFLSWPRFSAYCRKWVKTLSLCLSDVRVNYTILTPKCYEYQHRSNWSFKKLCICMRRDQRNGTGEKQVSKGKSKKGHNTGNKMGLHFHTC